MEKELVRALRTLDLHELPDAAIKSVFDTGGTALRTRLGTATADDEWLAAATTDRLSDLDRAFGKYLKNFLAIRASNSGSDGGAGDNVADSTIGSPLWGFFASEISNEVIMGGEHDRAHHYAAYRALFTLLQALINIGDGYARLEGDDKASALVKALIASKVYLTWLQLPGGSAYGLFMPFVYRQVLDVIRKWVDAALFHDKLTAVNGGRGSLQRDRTPLKSYSGGSRAHRTSDDDDSDTVNTKKLVRAGSELLDTLVSFLEHFALSSSKESVVPTIETVIHVQIVGSTADSGVVATAAGRSHRVLQNLLLDMHGDVVQIARVIVHCYIPGISFQDTKAAESRSGLKFHKIAIESVGLVQSNLMRSLACSEEEDADGADHISNLLLGIAQNTCLQAPDRSEERQRVLLFAFQTVIATELQEADRIRFIRFLASYSRSSKAKNRQFGVELVGKLILEPSTWSVVSSLPPELDEFVGIAPLLEILADRSRDRVSSVRAKAIGAISSFLTAGLKDKQAEALDDDALGDTEPTPDPLVIAGSLGDILYAPCEDDADKLQETPLMQRLVELFRDGLHDEKTFVRKAAIQALEALIVVRYGSIDPSLRKDLFDVQSRCTDSSLLVRIQAIKSLSSVLLKFPDDEEAQRLWNLGVLPLCVDPEASVQSAALELVKSVIFDRITGWYSVRNNADEREVASSVWMLMSHVDGVMVRCAQKALRLLLKDAKVDVEKIIKAAIYAIKTCLAELESAGEAEPQYWSFSWILLEELAHSGLLVEAAKAEQHNWGIVVECWNKLQDDELPTEFADGSKRILRVIAALSAVIDAQDAKEIADSILASLHSFSIPINVIAEAVLALHSICKAKAPSEAKGREISFAWGKQLLAGCESNLRACFEGKPELMLEQTCLIQKQLICIGEIALLEFNKDEEKSRESNVSLISILTAKSLVQLFLPPEIVPNGFRSSQVADEFSSPLKESSAVAIPIPIRVCAFVTLGKLCLRDQDLAKSCITMLIRELRTCPNQDIRSNILLILGDLCIRYTALVDIYISTIALSFLDESALIRRNALLLFSQLILQDYVKWRESLLRFFLRAVVDEDEELSNLARHVLCGPLLLKAPHLFTNKFIEMIFVFNKFDGKVNFSEPFEREGVEEIALPGSARFPKRSQLYKFLLQNMSDEQKLQISMKLCTEVLEEVTEGKLKLCENPSEITDFGTEAILKDTFAILCSPDIKLSASRERDGEDGELEDPVEPVEGGTTVASQLAAAKGKLLSKMSKKNFLENVVPVLIGLKHKLESKRSPLMRYLLHYIRELFKMYGQEVRDILNSDPQMAMEVEYDLRQFELQQKQLQEFQHYPRGTSTPTKNATTGSGPRTPLQVLDGVRTPQLLSAASRAMRRQSMPAASTPAHPVRQRHVSSDDGKPEHAPSTMLFSPNKGVSKSKWQVTAKSPVVLDKTRRRSGSNFTQEALEETMQRDLASAFDSASSPPSSPVGPRRKENASPSPVGEDYEALEFVKLPLKKKSKRKEKPDTKKSKLKEPQAQQVDSMDLNTPDVRRSKRKR